MGAASDAYLLIFRESTPERYEAMTREERRRALADWNAWCDKLAAAGKLQDGHPLLPEGRVISRAAAGRRMDGPFAESKEMIGGYFFLHAGSMDEAIAIAEESPNLQHGQTVEVRPVAEGCHLARSLGLRGMREPIEEAAASSGDDRAS
ncbi:MAG TPA: YciI family protein [Gemmatimonadaceae bacterium]|nr:YciI family protein [Gemmatimonadaceae bacterium]